MPAVQRRRFHICLDLEEETSAETSKRSPTEDFCLAFASTGTEERDGHIDSVRRE